MFSFFYFFSRLQVYPLHSSVTLEEQNNVFLSPVPGYRKVGWLGYPFCTLSTFSLETLLMRAWWPNGWRAL